MIVERLKYEGAGEPVHVHYIGESERGRKKRVKEKCEDTPHPDLVGAMQRLREYWRQSWETKFDIRSWDPEVVVVQIDFEYNDDHSRLLECELKVREQGAEDPVKTETPGAVSVAPNSDLNEALWEAAEEAIAYVEGKRETGDLFEGDPNGEEEEGAPA